MSDDLMSERSGCGVYGFETGVGECSLHGVWGYIN